MWPGQQGRHVVFGEREQVFREADDKMAAAVRDEGLTVDEFNVINHQLPQDPDLEQRVNAMLQ